MATDSAADLLTHNDAGELTQIPQNEVVWSVKCWRHWSLTALCRLTFAALCHCLLCWCFWAAFYRFSLMTLCHSFTALCHIGESVSLIERCRI